MGSATTNEVATDSKTCMDQSTAGAPSILPIDNYGPRFRPAIQVIDCAKSYTAKHKWRIIENFHAEFPRDASAPRKYAVYCVYCLTSKGIEVNINQ